MDKEISINASMTLPEGEHVDVTISKPWDHPDEAEVTVTSFSGDTVETLGTRRRDIQQGVSSLTAAASAAIVWAVDEII